MARKYRAGRIRQWFRMGPLVNGGRDGLQPLTRQVKKIKRQIIPKRWLTVKASHHSRRGYKRKNFRGTFGGKRGTWL